MTREAAILNNSDKITYYRNLCVYVFINEVPPNLTHMKCRQS